MRDRGREVLGARGLVAARTGPHAGAEEERGARAFQMNEKMSPVPQARVLARLEPDVVRQHVGVLERFARVFGGEILPGRARDLERVELAQWNESAPPREAHHQEIRLDAPQRRDCGPFREGVVDYERAAPCEHDALDEVADARVLVRRQADLPGLQAGHLGVERLGAGDAGQHLVGHLARHAVHDRAQLLEAEPRGRASAGRCRLESLSGVDRPKLDLGAPDLGPEQLHQGRRVDARHERRQDRPERLEVVREVGKETPVRVVQGLAPRGPLAERDVYQLWAGGLGRGIGRRQALEYVVDGEPPGLVGPFAREVFQAAVEDLLFVEDRVEPRQIGKRDRAEAPEESVAVVFVESIEGAEHPRERVALGREEAVPGAELPDDERPETLGQPLERRAVLLQERARLRREAPQSQIHRVHPSSSRSAVPSACSARKPSREATVGAMSRCVTRRSTVTPLGIPEPTARSPTRRQPSSPPRWCWKPFIPMPSRFRP